MKNITYGKSYEDISKYERHEIFSSKFYLPIEGSKHEFEITGVGPIAVKVSLFLKFKDIEVENNSFLTKLKNELIDIYFPLIEENKSYQDKLAKITEEYNKQVEKQDKIRKEVQEEEAEKERKRKELEEMLNRNKPKNNQRPFKMY